MNRRCRNTQEKLLALRDGHLTGDPEVITRAHLAVCPECHEQAQTLDALARLGSAQELPSLPPLVERRFIVAALEGRLPDPKVPRLRWQPRLALALGVTSAATLALVFAWLGWSSPSPSSPEPAAVAVTAPEWSKPGLAEPVRLSDGRSMIPVNPTTVLWLSENARVEGVIGGERQVVVRVLHGQVLAEIEGAQAGYRFIFETRAGAVEAKGTVYSVTVPEQGPVMARVLRGVVEIRSNATETAGAISYSLREGEEGEVGGEGPRAASFAALEQTRCLMARCELEVPSIAQPEEPPANEKSSRPTVPKTHRTTALPRQPAASLATPPQNAEADALLSLAREQRRAGLYPMAAATYQRLIDEHQGHSAAHTALVSLAQLELVELDDSLRAVAHFRQYLSSAPGGYLAEEARLGVVRALTELGRNDDVVREATLYLTAYPGGYGAAEVLRLRADSRGRLGQCEQASADLERLKALWPGSPQAAAARLVGSCDR